MLLRYRDPKFWETFHANHWRPQVPTVFRQPLREPLFSEPLLLGALKRFAAGLEAGDRRKTCLVQKGATEVPPRPPLKKLFREESSTFEELEAAWARLYPKTTFGLMVTQMHTADPALWAALAAFLNDAASWIDVPAPRAFLDLFYGNYQSTFTGLHKDTQEIVAFVVRGKKRMLAWPFEYFLERVEDVTPADRFFNKRLGIDHRPYRKDAIVLDAEPGDVFYWPSHYWHVSEVIDGQFSAMLSLGLVRRPGPAERTNGVLESKAMTTGAPAAEAGRRLRWKTSFGFELGGPDVEEASEATSRVVKNPTSVIAWEIRRRERRLLVATNGHSVTLPWSPKLVELLERLAAGETVALPKERSAAKPWKASETGWNLRCELKTTVRTTRRDPRAWLVDWLRREQAVRPLPTGPGR